MTHDRLGATAVDDGRTRFVVWAPASESVDLHLLAPVDRLVQMTRGERGYHAVEVEGAPPGSLYRYRLDGGVERPDPASRAQPQGVHGPSQVLDDRFAWGDASWTGLALTEYVMYELHVGAFTTEGTFDAIEQKLDALRSLGITAIELMPVAQFPGNRNWGYDGVYPYAVQSSYGGASGLKRLVDACHRRGLAVVLDVVYNHLGPEGNYLGSFGPYFTDRYKTRWGTALNFDGPGSDEVRRYFIGSALQWIADFHIDALRLDALHAIVDPSARPFIEELAAAVHAEAAGRRRVVHVIGEVDRNDPRYVQPTDRGGYGLDAQWNDDFHHALHSLLTGERTGYYQDFGDVQQLARAFADGFVYDGRYSAYRGRRHGRALTEMDGSKLVVFAQNHDQIGNRMRGERLSTLVSLEGLKLAAGAVLLSPCVPLLFMGEEFGARAPFQYFVSHSDAELIEAVRRGRRAEFARFAWTDGAPDPQAESTFAASRVDWPQADTAEGRALSGLARALLALRRERPALRWQRRDSVEAQAFPEARVLLIHRAGTGERLLAIFNFSGGGARVELEARGGRWTRILDSSDPRWHGPGTVTPTELDLDRPARVDVNAMSFAVLVAADGSR